MRRLAGWGVALMMAAGPPVEPFGRLGLWYLGGGGVEVCR